MDIQFSKDAIKTLMSMNNSQRLNIKERISGLVKNPPEGDIKPLQGKNGQFRLRVGQYRIIYHIEKRVVKIDKIGARGDIYK